MFGMMCYFVFDYLVWVCVLGVCGMGKEDV